MMRLLKRVAQLVEWLCHEIELRRIRKHELESEDDHLTLEEITSLRRFRRKGFSAFDAQLYNLDKGNDFHEYITTWESYQPVFTNNSKYWSISSNKYLFYLVYSRFIDTPKVRMTIRNGKIQWLERDNDTDIYDFILENDGAVLKDTFGANGVKVYVLTPVSEGLKYKDEVWDRNRLNEVVSDLKFGILQDRLVQGEFANSLFEKSINTIRLITMRKNGFYEHEVVAAAIRIGTNKSAPTDNCAQGGGSCLIDLETGELGPMRTYFDKDENGQFIVMNTHPDTGAQITGRVIPNWTKVKQTISDLTNKIYFFETLAWDIVLMDDDIQVIETNLKSSLSVFQIHGPMKNTLLGEKYREHGWLVDE